MIEDLRLKVKHFDAIEGGRMVNNRDSGWRFTLRANPEVHDDWRVLWTFARLLAYGAVVDVACPECGLYFGSGTSPETVCANAGGHITLARQMEQMAHVRASPDSCKRAKWTDHRAQAAGE